MNIFKHPGWKNLISKISDIKNIDWRKGISKISSISFFSTNIRQLSVLLLLGIFLTTGMIGSIEAAEPEVMAPAEISAHKVILNGRTAGYVSDPATAQIIMDDILQDAAGYYGMEVSADHKLIFEEVSIAPEKLSTKDELEKSLRDNTEIKVNAVVIYANDEKIAALKSEEDAQQLLDHVKSLYVDDPAKLEEATFQEEVRIVPTPVSFSEIQDIESAKAVIQEGQETVEEYTIKSGDTFWDISRTYKIKFDDLVAMNPDVNPEKLKLGQVIRLSYPKTLLNVVTTEIIEYEKSIPYKTETKKDDSMYTTQSKVIQKGQEGVEKVEARVIRVNGIEKEREILSKETIKEPVNKIVAKGTKKAPASVSRGSGRLIWPVKGTITSRYGQRWGRLHKGLDIAISKGTPVYAADSGKVIFSGWSGGYGNLVQIDHGGGMVTYYAHMSKRVVSDGQSVSKGQLVGYVGSTGNSTGPHLHFEVRINDTPKNPLNYLN